MGVSSSGSCSICGAEHPADSPCVPSRVGSVIGGKYTIVRPLGRGGMGHVYEARHATLTRRFAIKFLLPEYAADRDVLRRFENEARAAGRIEHPNIAAVLDFGCEADGSPYIVMEYLLGEDCARLLRRSGPLPQPRAADIVLQACRGLVVAHGAGIVHRDIKPENLFLTDAGDGTDLIKVLDFGIAKLLSAHATAATRTGSAMGTAYYMSPEQARGDHVDARSDVWSLGVVLYELLCGRRPFEGQHVFNIIHDVVVREPPPLRSLNPGVSAALCAVVERAMTKSVSERIQTVSELAEALTPFARRALPAAPNTGPDVTRPTPPSTPTPVAREITHTDPHAIAGQAIPRSPGASRLAIGKRALLGTFVGAFAVAGAVLLARRGPEPVPSVESRVALANSAAVVEPSPSHEMARGAELEASPRPVSTGAAVAAPSAPGGTPNSSASMVAPLTRRVAPASAYVRTSFGQASNMGSVALQPPSSTGGGRVATGTPEPGIAALPVGSVVAPSTGTAHARTRPAITIDTESPY